MDTKKDNKPLISIIIPVYNSEKYLKKCLESMLNQTFKDIEVICINDGSTDNSLKILEEYKNKDSHIKVINNKNQGPGLSRQCGLNNVNPDSKYLMFCDSDDWYEPDMCEKMFNAIETHNVDIVMCDTTVHIIENDNNQDRLNGCIGHRKIRITGKNEINNKNISQISTLLFNKILKFDIIKKYGIEFPDAKMHDDSTFIVQYLLLAKTYYGLDEKLYNYAYRKNSLVYDACNNNDKKLRYPSIECIKLLNDFIKRNDHLLIDRNYLLKKFCDFIYFDFYNLKKQNKKIRLLKKAHSIFKNISYIKEDKPLLFAIKKGKIYQAVNQLEDKLILSPLQQIFSVKNKKDYKQITIAGIKIKLKSKKLEAKQRELQINDKIESLNKEISNLQHQNNKLKTDAMRTKNQIMLSLKRRTPQPELKSIAVHIVDHCNLRCCGCDHFAPLAQKRFEELDVFEKDIKRFAELSGAKLGILKLMGGEPLLHPQLTDFMRISRQYLPDTRIEVVTNAILLNLQKESFWNACKEYNIVIVPTKYPLKINYEKAEQTAESYGVKLEYYGNTNSVLKTSYHIPLDLEGKQDAVNNFLNCFHANNCVFLKQGKLYTCTVAPNINQFNKFFNKNIPLSDREGIDIHKAQSIDEILEFLAKPIPFCKYCNVNGRTFGHPWGISKKEIVEWI